MQVNFKGLYLLTGKSSNTKGNGYAMDETRDSKIESFLKETKDYRDDKGYSYYNKNNGDYYLAVKKMYEADFEDVVDDFHLDCYKVGDEVAQNAEAISKEFGKLQEMRYGRLKFFKRLYSKVDNNHENPNFTKEIKCYTNNGNKLSTKI